MPGSRGMVGVIVAAGYCWTAGLTGIGGYLAGTAEAERSRGPTRVVEVRRDVESGLRADRLRARVAELTAQLERARRPAPREDDGRRGGEDESRLYPIAERAVMGAVGSLTSPKWLRDTYKVHPRRDGWIVEGIVLESNSSSQPAGAYFWYVDVRRGDDPVVPGEATRLVINLYRHELRGDRWVSAGRIGGREDQPYPTLEY